VIQIESRRALENLDEIARLDGIDALVVGTADLSFGLGDPLRVDSAELVSAVDMVAKAASRHGRTWGVAIGELPDWTTRLRANGASMLVFSSDASIYADAVAHCTTRLEAVERHGPGSNLHGPRPQATEQFTETVND
jgi:4-hydroxy-2-oxoheptanedioate aldolase